MFSFFTRGWKRQIAEFKFDDGRADKFGFEGDDTVELKRACERCANLSPRAASVLPAASKAEQVAPDVNQVFRRRGPSAHGPGRDARVHMSYAAPV
jgi:hypothetical protein